MKTVIPILSLFLVLSSCDNALEEVPEDLLSVQNFYTNEADALAAVYAMYEPMRANNYYGARYPGHFEVLADYANGRGSYAPVSEYQGLNTVNIGRTDNMWALMYQAINRANTVIGRVPDIDMDSQLRDALVAEAHFIRAFNYFNLVRNWGGVPLRINEVTDVSTIGAPRASEQEIYDFIVSDLQIAENDLPAQPTESGRATSWAAKTLLAYVYLTLENWTNAASKAKEVIDGGAFSLVQVSQPDDFNTIFGPEIISSSEEILSLKYTRIDDQGLFFVSFMHNAAAGFSAAGFRVTLGDPNSSFIQNWDNQDLRKDFNTYTSYVDGDGNVVELPENEPLLFRKFSDGAAPTSDGHGNDYPLLRYPDVLLIFAEAASEANNGPTSEAYEAINQVRRRAYGLDPMAPDAGVDLAGLSAVAFKDAVLLERAHEFIMESKRWYDLKRTGRVQDVIEATGKSFSSIHLLAPIPEAEIQNNPEIGVEDQNPGY
ncbi:RagB/SusD family nutrient uptake outer membrane protein [Ulvibacterium marinum]|nr:RagB/SusD family nutrient uptake outer membrane protein [Ulvibacterium marinum]